MNAWLNELKKELEKHFYPDEVQDILAYYEEMIEDRSLSGESIAAILQSYDQKSIVREMMPEVLSKRTNETQGEKIKTTKQLFLAIWQSSVKIPISFLYTISIFVIGTIMFSIAISMLASLAVLIYYGFNLFETTLSLYEKIGMIGLGIIILSISGLILASLYRLLSELYRKTLIVFSQMTKRKGDLS